MNVLENIRDAFSIFHDGEIKSWNGNFEKLTLTIECKYLAEKLNNSFSDFYFEFYHVKDLCFLSWSNQIDLDSTTVKKIEDLFKLKLEILSSDINDGKVKIDCKHSDLSVDYYGGELFISSKEFHVLDQERHELSIDQLDEICNDYWNNLNQ